MSVRLQKWHIFLLLALTVISLTSCGTRPRETYHLGEARVVAMEASANKLRSLKNIQLLVTLPNALKIFDGQDIVMDQGGRLSYLKNAQLGDRLPNMLQERLIQAFEDSKRLGGVARPGEGLAINYQILSDIRQFAVKLGVGESAQAVIELSVKIVDDRGGQVKAARVFSSSVAILGNDNQAYVQGLERALGLVLVQVVNWSFDYL